MGENIKEDVLWITSQVIRYIFEDYLDQACSTAAKISFGSDSWRRSTLIWGVIKGHLSANKMMAKSIKDHPIVVGDYDRWIVSNSGRKEAMDAKVMATKLKYDVDDISSPTTSAAKSINELNTSVASVKKAADTAISKVGSLAKNLRSSEESGVQGGLPLRRNFFWQLKQRMGSVGELQEITQWRTPLMIIKSKVYRYGKA